MDPPTVPADSLTLPPPPPWWYESPPPSASNQGEIIVFLVVLFAVTILGFLLRGFLKRRQDSRDCAEAAAAAAVAAPWPRLVPSQHFEEMRLRPARPGGPSTGPSRAANPAARLPAFKYNRSVKHEVTGGEEETAATCSVCLGAFQLGDTVRLLPVCLHLYHVECIDPWLDAHSTCPLCRSDADPTMNVGGLPPASSLSQREA